MPINQPHLGYYPVMDMPQNARPVAFSMAKEELDVFVINPDPVKQDFEFIDHPNPQDYANY